jgi:TM2 domain-containing membrane protein YozV
MSRDLRRYARQTTTRLIVGAILLLFVVGDGLIYVIYGRNAALMGIMCLILGLSPLLLIGLALWVIGWVARRANRD